MAVDEDPITVELTTRQWVTIDAGMDNAVSSAIDALDEESEQLAAAIRAAGWAQVPPGGGGWPPMAQVVTVVLSAAQWRFVAADLERSARSAERLGDRESLDLVRSASDALRPQLPA